MLVQAFPDSKYFAVLSAWWHNYAWFFVMVTHRMVACIAVWEMRHCQWPNWAIQTGDYPSSTHSGWISISPDSPVIQPFLSSLSLGTSTYEHPQVCHYHHLPSERTAHAWEHAQLPSASSRWNAEGGSMGQTKNTGTRMNHGFRSWCHPLPVLPSTLQPHFYHSLWG